MKVKAIIRALALAALGILLVVAIVTSTQTPAPVDEYGEDTIWDEQMTIGNLDAKNHFVIYSDLVCPYCVAFENAMVENEDGLERYIESNDILIEVRLSDFLYEFGQYKPANSRYSAIATYCARDEGKFWDYYNAAISKVWKEFFKTAGKAGAADMNNLDKTYWINIGKSVGLGESFVSCVNENKSLEEIETVAEKMSHLVNGLPYFKFNNKVFSGFDLSWGWNEVLMYFQQGLDS